SRASSFTPACSSTYQVSTPSSRLERERAQPPLGPTTQRNATDGPSDPGPSTIQAELAPICRTPRRPFESEAAPMRRSPIRSGRGSNDDSQGARRIQGMEQAVESLRLT